MQYFKIEPGKFIEFNETNNTARILVKTELRSEKQELIARIAVNPQPSNAELLAWARANYPFVDHSAEQTRLDEINLILEAIKAI